ncbi:MAG: D-2-hydroxyacid dehydrogenase [Rhodobacteraceae bacterium]|nr:D-2-hydroxyacid dehydrogenase [Paracoccaceae bacterium]
MPPPTVLIHNDTPDAALAALAAAHPDISARFCDSYAALAETVERLRPDIVYSICFAGRAGFPRAPLLDAGIVRWVAVGGSGTDHLAHWNPGRVTVTNAAGVAADMMAEYAVGAMLHFAQEMQGFARAQAARRWGVGMVRPVAGSRVLVIGLGHTGRAVARLSRALGMHVTGLRAHPAPDENCTEVLGIDSLARQLPLADHVVVSVPLIDSTRGLIGARELAAMRPDAVLIDISRGGVVRGDALIDALGAGHLKGAALDVFETEPLPSDSPLWTMPNVRLTPHCCGVTPDWGPASARLFARNLTRYRAGKPLFNVVDPARGY